MATKPLNLNTILKGFAPLDIKVLTSEMYAEVRKARTQLVAHSDLCDADYLLLTIKSYLNGETTIEACVDAREALVDWLTSTDSGIWGSDTEKQARNCCQWACADIPLMANERDDALGVISNLDNFTRLRKSWLSDTDRENECKDRLRRLEIHLQGHQTNRRAKAPPPSADELTSRSRISGLAG